MFQGRQVFARRLFRQCETDAGAGFESLEMFNGHRVETLFDNSMVCKVSKQSLHDGCVKTHLGSKEVIREGE